MFLLQYIFIYLLFFQKYPINILLEVLSYFIQFFIYLIAICILKSDNQGMGKI
jgi:hypothetical protein